MQTTQQDCRDGTTKEHQEMFTQQFVNSRQETERRLYEKMNNRLFVLEEQGHRLVAQTILDEDAATPAKRRVKGPTVSDLVHAERAKKAQKKVNRMNKKGVYA